MTRSAAPAAVLTYRRTRIGTVGKGPEAVVFRGQYGGGLALGFLDQTSTRHQVP